MAKYTPSLSNDDAYQAYLDDQERRRKEAEKGQIRYAEAAKASRIQYTLPGYQGKSQNQGKTYQWERDFMQNEKIKGAGNSYTKKFDALTKRMGMTPGQAEEFRKYMDFKEDSQHVDPKMNKDGTINQSQSLKYARDARLKTDVIDEILNNMHKTGVKNIQNDREKKEKFAKDTQKATENMTKERDGFLGFLDRTLGRAGNAAHKVFGDDFVNAENENYRQNNLEELKKDPTDKEALAQLQMLNTTEREAQGGVEKTADFVGRALGEVAPYTIGGAYGAADAVLGKLGLNAIKSPLAKEAIRGATAGGVVGTGKAVVRDQTTEYPKDFDAVDYLKTIGLEAGLAGAGDAAIGALARNLNLKGLTKGLSDDVANNYAKALGGGRTPEQVELALRESITPHNVLADPVREVPKPVENPINLPPQQTDAENILRQLLGEEPPVKPNTLDNFTPNTIPKVEIPKALDEVTPQTSMDISGLNPEGIAKAYNEKQWYHGTGTNNLTKETLDPLVGDHQGLFGHGVYMTDNPEIANGYAKSRGKRTSNPTIYDAKVNMNRVLDLEKPVSENAKNALNQFTRSLDYTYNKEFGEDGYFSKIVNDMANKKATTEEIIQKMRQEITDFSHEAGIPTSEFVENFQDLAINLKSHGYDGITHTGGGRTGNDAHRVLIALDPNDWYAQTGRTGQVTDFNPNNPSDLLNKVKNDKWNNIEGQPNAGSLDEMLNFLEGKPSTTKTKIPSEQEFIDQELAPFRESAEAQSQARQSWETVVKGAQEQAKRIKDYYGKIVPDGNSKDMINEIPPQFRAAKKGKGNDIYSFAEEEGFSSADEAIAFLKQIDLDSKMKLKDLMPKDDYVLSSDEWDMLEQVARQKYAETHGGQQPSDKVLDQLVQNKSPKTGARTMLNAPTPGIRQTPDEILKNVNNSQAPEQVLESLTRPKSDSDMLLRMDLQRFESDPTSIISDSKPIESKSAIDSIKNPIKRKLNQFYENAINSTHSAKVAHTQVLENAIKKAEASELQPKKVAALKEQLKSVKKNGSDLEKSIQNQAAAGNKAKTFLDGHMDNLQTALGSTKPEDMAEAIRYQVAKNIRWIWDNVNPDYVVGGGWDKGRVNTIVNSGVGNPKLESFTDAMKGLTQERLDLALKHGLINKNAHAALSKNPFYIPMARDVTPGMDNVGRSLKEGTTKNKGQAGAYFIQSLGDGDAEALYKDPLESLMTGTFSLFKNIAKEDTHKQLYNMAKLDSDKLFSRIVSKKQFDAKGGIAVPTPKGTKYIQIQDDLQKMIQENDLPYDLNVLGKVTSAFAGLKTRSLEYHMTGVPRDLMEGYLKGQTNNPVKYLSELVKAAKEHNLSAKQAGAYFDKAYKDGMNGINSEKMMKEYARQNGNVKPFNPKDKESWKELTSTILRIADMPFKPIKAIGQLSDELPRTVEVKATEKAFMKQHGTKIDNIKRALDQVNAKLEASSQATDPFDPALQGVDKLKGQKEKLENLLNEYDKNLEREQTFRGRDLMNFSRAGRGGVAKHIRQYAIFANTTTQSKDKLVRSFIERPGATIGKVALLTAPLVYAEHVMQQNLSEGDKKIYDNLPTWAKQYNYVYVNNGTVYTVPKIQELALLTNPIEAILAGNKEDLNASARLAVKETIPYQLGNIAQGLVPNTDGSVTIRKNTQVPSTVLSPALDVAANDKLGFNRNAISFADKFGRQDAKANKFTLDVFKKTFGNKARADYAQYLATQYPGDAGKYGAHILDYLMEPDNTDKLDAMLQNLNPLQDRIYSKNGEVLGHKVVKNPPKKPAVKK